MTTYRKNCHSLLFDALMIFFPFDSPYMSWLNLHNPETDDASSEDANVKQTESDSPTPPTGEGNQCSACQLQQQQNLQPPSHRFPQQQACIRKNYATDFYICLKRLVFWSHISYKDWLFLCLQYLCLTVRSVTWSVTWRKQARLNKDASKGRDIDYLKFLKDWTNGKTDRRRDPHIEMHGLI